MAVDIADKSIKERGEAIGLVMQNPNQMISKPMIFDEVALGTTGPWRAGGRGKGTGLR